MLTICADYLWYTPGALDRWRDTIAGQFGRESAPLHVAKALIHGLREADAPLVQVPVATLLAWLHAVLPAKAPPMDNGDVILVRPFWLNLGRRLLTETGFIEQPLGSRLIITHPKKASAFCQRDRR